MVSGVIATFVVRMLVVRMSKSSKEGRFTLETLKGFGQAHIFSCYMYGENNATNQRNHPFFKYC